MSKHRKKNYSFYRNGNTVICVGRYARMPIKGIAVCSPEDTFDFEVGKKIAQARCEYKIMKRRLADCEKRLYEAERGVSYSIAKFEKAGRIYEEVFRAYSKCAKEEAETRENKTGDELI